MSLSNLRVGYLGRYQIRDKESLTWDSRASLAAFDVLICELDLDCLLDSRGFTDGGRRVLNSTEYLKAIQHWDEEFRSLRDRKCVVLVAPSSNEEYCVELVEDEPCETVNVFNLLPNVGIQSVRKEGSGSILTPGVFNQVLEKYYGPNLKSVPYTFVFTGGTPTMVTGGSNRATACFCKFNQAIFLYCPIFPIVMQGHVDKLYAFAESVYSSVYSPDDAPSIPEWIRGGHLLQASSILELEVLNCERQISEYQDKLASLKTELARTSKIYNLLIGTGKSLEKSVQAFLSAINIEYKNYASGPIEIDLIIETDAEIIVVEMEGKPQSQVTFKKLQQLLSRPANLVETYPAKRFKLVLIGNSHLDTILDDRPPVFHEDVIKSCDINKVSLIESKDLFNAYKILESQSFSTESKAEIRTWFLNLPAGYSEASQFTSSY